MRLILPLTGTVIREGSVFGDGLLGGDPDDPIRPVDIDLGNVSWVMVNVDLEKGEMEIEVTPALEVIEPTGEIDGEGNPVYETRKTTQAEKADLLQYAKDLVEGQTKDELYVMSKCAKLKRPFKK